MVKIEDGRGQFYQWDLGQRLLIEGYAAGTEVHFIHQRKGSTDVVNRDEQTALIVEAYTENEKVYANVPNILLQRAGELQIYVCPKTGDTVHTAERKAFTIIPRAKPDDYIYTETEVKRWENLAKGADEAIAAANHAVSDAKAAATHANYEAKNAKKAADTANNAATAANNAADAASAAASAAREAASTANSAADYYRPGDVNRDGVIDEEDYLLVQRYVNRENVTIDLAAADVNGDGEVTQKDVVLLEQYVNGEDVELLESPLAPQKLPAVTEEDEGKVLSVVGGRWTATEGGSDGKSAYAYAVEGGYAGSESEFAAKLAEEMPKAFYVVIKDNGDGTGTSDKTFAEILEAHENGSAVIARIDTDGVVSVVQNLMTVDGEVAGVIGIAADTTYWAGIITPEEVLVANLPIIPTALPNPYALTINGVTYDGSAAVDITVTGGSTDENTLLGQTPFTTSEAATVKLVGEGECTYTLKGTTVADFSTVSQTATSAEFEAMDGYYEIRSTGGNGWYASHIDLAVNGLTAGETYKLVVDGRGLVWNDRGMRTDDTSKPIYTNGHYIVRNSSGTTLATLQIDTQNSLNSIEFTADTANITIVCYPAQSYYWSSGVSKAYIKDLYINLASDGTVRSDIINESGTFTDSRIFAQLSAGVVITADPVCYVYSVSGAGDTAAGASLPLAGKKIVCFGDSLFGMYRGDTSAPAYVAERTGATVHNVGFGGCRMSVHPTTGYAEFCMWALAKAIASGDWSAQDAAAPSGSDYFAEQLELLKSIDFAEADAIVIHYGTNDFTGGVSIDDTSNLTDYHTLCGALRYSVETLSAAYPELRIFVSLPAFRYWTADDGTVTYSNSYTNGNGKTLTEFVEAIANTAKEYNLPVIDSYYGLGVNKVNASTFLADGVHHNLEGRKRFGNYIGSRLIAEF